MLTIRIPPDVDTTSPCGGNSAPKALPIFTVTFKSKNKIRYFEKEFFFRCSIPYYRKNGFLIYR